jgi:ribosomal protein S27E
MRKGFKIICDNCGIQQQLRTIVSGEAPFENIAIEVEAYVIYGDPTAQVKCKNCDNFITID